jgi:hypothetical protein
MQRRRSYQWLSDLVDNDTPRVVGFQRLFGVQWVTPPSTAAVSAAAGSASGLPDRSLALTTSTDTIPGSECVRGNFLIYCLFRFGAFLGEVCVAFETIASVG